MREYFIWLAKVMTLVFVFGFILPMLLVSSAMVVSSSSNSSSAIAAVGSEKTVAVIELTGVIMSAKEVVTQLYKQANNRQVKAIVLRIDSPGGAVAPSQEVYRAVKELKERKPIVASMGSVSASGGLYSALPANSIFAQEGTLTGSIGVIMQIPNFSSVTEKIGVDMVTIKSGQLKDVGNSFRPMTSTEREFLQTTADTIHNEFIAAVARSRSLDREVVESFADGRVIVGMEAKRLGLIDELGGVQEAARKALELAGVALDPDEDPDMFYAEDKFAQFKKLFNSSVQTALDVVGTGSFTGSVGIRPWFLMAR